MTELYGEHADSVGTEFIDDMAEAYSGRDVVIARSGALTGVN